MKAYIVFVEQLFSGMREIYYQDCSALLPYYRKGGLIFCVVAMLKEKEWKTPVRVILIRIFVSGQGMFNSFNYHLQVEEQLDITGYIRESMKACSELASSEKSRVSGVTRKRKYSNMVVGCLSLDCTHDQIYN